MTKENKDRVEFWLPIVVTVVLFRLFLFPVEAILTTVGVTLRCTVPFEFVRHIIATIPVFTLVLTIALAALTERTMESRLLQIETKKRTVLFLALLVIAVFPWQIVARTRAEPVSWDKLPKPLSKEMSLQPSPAGDAETSAPEE
jgi:hypothetical protein